MKKLSACIALAGLVSAALAQVNQQTPAEKLGWDMSIHAYTYRLFPFDEAVDKTASLGIKYMSLSGSINLVGTRGSGTTDMTEAQKAAVQAKLKSAGILKLVNVGVVSLPADEARSRKVFEFAKSMGIDTLVSEPTPDAMDTVEKLCKEYNIKVAIHNHPQPNPYWHPTNVLAVVKGRSPLIGACADTGHWARCGLDPVECLKLLEGRIITLHFKDLNKKGAGAHDVPWGTGVCDVKGMMTELKRQGYHGYFGVEYEYNWTNSTPEIAECEKFFNATCAELAK
jgi:sugar phosphate isomerase/epimerase